eukprot:3075456-Rhodomonas_salina.2
MLPIPQEKLASHVHPQPCIPLGLCLCASVDPASLLEREVQGRQPQLIPALFPSVACARRREPVEVWEVPPR